jgi:signal peptidase
MLVNTTSAERLNWSAERSALVAEALRCGGNSSLRVRLRVHGESMLPALWPGDMVEIANCSPEDLRTGEIVLAMRDGRFFLHRLAAPCTPNGFLLRGDSMPGPDPLLPPEALVGRLVRDRSTLGATWFGVAWSRALGMLFCHFSFARRVALRLHSHRMLSASQFRNSEYGTDLISAEIASAKLGAS